MFLEINCGGCESSVQVDSDWEESVWLLAWRFTAGHVGCGTFTDLAELPVKPPVLTKVETDEDDDDTEGSTEEG